MSFRNPLLLAGIAAAVLPIVLHLLGRAWARPLPWGATMFLHGDAGDVAAGRFRDRMLLILRCVAVAILAIALARPVSAEADAADAGKVVILVLDASPSTEHAEQSTPRFELIRRAALDRLQLLKQGDQAALVVLGLGYPADVALTPDRQAVVSQIVSLAPGPLPADLAEGERRARAMLTDNAIEGGEIDLIADRQRGTWEPLRQTANDTTAGGPRVVAMPMGSTRNDNAWIDSIELQNPPAIAGRPARFAINLCNDGDVPQGELTLRLSPGRGQASTGSVAIDAHGRSQVFRTVVPDRAGSAIFTATLSPTGMPDDDTVRQSMDVLPVPRVKFIGANEATTNPTTSPASRFSDTDVAVLSDAAPDLATLAAVEQFVAGGGGLLIAPGPSLTPAAWNQRFWKGGFGLAPVAAADVAIEKKAWPADVAPFVLPGGDAIDWTNLPVRRYWRFVPGGNEAVVARVNGDPLIIERRFGRGRVTTLAVPLDGQWTVDGKLMTYRGLIDVLAPRLIDRPVNRNVDVGVPLESVLRLGRDRNVTVTRPDGRVDRINLTVVGGQGVFRYTRTDLPGRYTVRGADQPADDWFVRPDPAESRLSLLDDTHLAAVLGKTSIDLHSNPQTRPRDESSQSIGLITALAVMLAVEMLITNIYLPRRERA